MLSRPSITRLSARDVQAYAACDSLTEGLLYLMVVFSPWAFGSTERWSIWVMNIGGYVLGGMFLVKVLIRFSKGFRAPQWDRPEEGTDPVCASNASSPPPRAAFTPSLFATALALLTVAILGYCLVSAINARATYDPRTLSFTYYDNYVNWLPHSFDSSLTWFTFWTYLGLASSFWAARDWLRGKSLADLRQDPSATNSPHPGEVVPVRLRRLLWLLAINGGLLGVEAIIQRLEGSGKLLFLVRPRIHQTADTQFGPYAYYANASQYFNLVWPCCLGFWWLLHRSRALRTANFRSASNHAPSDNVTSDQERSNSSVHRPARFKYRRRERNSVLGPRQHHLVLFCCAVMAACPIISTSRGGAIVSLIMLLVSALVFAGGFLLSQAQRLESRKGFKVTLCVLTLFFASALTLGFTLGWKALKPRMAQLQQGFQSRERDYDRARPMAADYPVFGTGPGTFESVSKLYQFAAGTEWWRQLHNDWLETRITFGWVGSSLIALAFLTMLLRWFAPGGICTGTRFVLLVWLALGGCLLHARFDFPFQVHSVLFLFLLLCAVLFTLSRRPCSC